MENELKNILQRVRILFFKYGIKSISMDDIARDLGISKKTLYQYVSDKAELVKLVMEMEMNDRDCLFAEVHDKQNNAMEVLFEISRINNKFLKEYNPAAYYDLRKYYPELYEKMVKFRRAHIEKYIINNVKQGIEEGIYRPNMDIQIIAKLSVSRIEQLMDSDYFSKEEVMTLHFFREVIEYHLRAIASPRGLELMEKLIKDIKLL